MTTDPIEIWKRGNQIIEVLYRNPSIVRWRKNPHDKAFRWTRLSKFHLWRHAAVRIDRDQQKGEA